MEYATLCATYAAVEATSKRLEKTAHIAELLQDADDDLGRVALLLQGRAFSAAEKAMKIGVSSKLMLKALARVTGSATTTLETAWSKTGDLGTVAEAHVGEKTQQTLFTASLSVSHVHEQVRRLASIEGKGSVDTKLKIISELLSNASPLEAKYVTRTILEELRIGIATGTMRDAIIYAFLAAHAGIEDGEIVERERYNEASVLVQGAYDRSNDFGIVARAARSGLDAIKDIELSVGVPLKVMLGVKGTTAREAMETLGPPIMLQYKYDGFRIQVHKDGDTITIFTRRLEDVTEQFPDVVERVREHIRADRCILDGEAIGIDPETGAYLPFQAVSQRIRRKHGIAEMAERLPVDVRLFDIMLCEDEEYLERPLRQRHEKLQDVIDDAELIGVAHTLITDDPKEAESFYGDATRAGEEGLFAKSLDSRYQPGTRVGNWIKIKATMEPLDVVVISAEWGEGKRSGWLTSFGIAIQDEQGELREIGKVATGLKELPEEGFSFPEITQMLEPLIEFTEGRYVKVKPEIVLEVGYDEIQQSPSYSSGYALRFPRVLRDRSDERAVDDISSLSYVTALYEQQGQHSDPVPQTD